MLGPSGVGVRKPEDAKAALRYSRNLPWWKRLALDPSYRERVQRIATECYKREMRMVRDFPGKLFSTESEHGVPLLSSAQYVCVEGNDGWATKHPSNIMKVSSLRTLRDFATATVLPTLGKDHDTCINDEVKRLFRKEESDNRLYGLSYIWDRQLPPMGFIRQWPPPHQGMWPTDYVHRPLQRVQLPSDRKERERFTNNPACIHVYRRDGEFLGVWRQSLLLLRYKIICCALHEEVQAGYKLSSRKRRSKGMAHLKHVPEFTTPLMRLQGDNTVKLKAGKVDIESVFPPTCWEGLAPSPSKVHVDQGYLNWCALHNSSPMVRQAVRDVYNMLPHDEDGRLTKEVFVEFVLDLLNLFFPLNNSASNIAIAEEEWAFRGTSELMSFDTFFERFFSFPFIFLRNFEEVTRDMYIEVWCLIRICLLETEDTIHSSARGITNNVTELLKQTLEQDYGGLAIHTPSRFSTLHNVANNVGNNNTNTIYQAPAKAKTVSYPLKGRFPIHHVKDIPVLISGIDGFTAPDVITLGCTNFRNTDKYEMFAMKRRVLEECESALYGVPSSRRVLFAHKKAERRVAEARETQPEEPRKVWSESEEGGYLTGTNMFASLASSPSCSATSPTNNVESVKKRRDALEELENRHIIEKLLATSVWYKRRRYRRRKEHNDAHRLVSRCHTSWEMFEYDVYEIPEENPTEVDDLISFVIDLPDDFFEVTTSLRMRNAVYRAHEYARSHLMAKDDEDDHLQAFEEKVKKEVESIWYERFHGPKEQCEEEDDAKEEQAELSMAKRSKETGTSALLRGRCSSPASSKRVLATSSRWQSSIRSQHTLLYTSSPASLVCGATASVSSVRHQEADYIPGYNRPTACRLRAEQEDEERTQQKKERRGLEMRLKLKEKMDSEYMKRVKLKSQRRAIPLVVRAAKKKTVE